MRDRTLVGRRAWIATAAFVLLVTLVALPPPADAAFPGKNGKIAFVHNNDIWVSNADGSGRTNLTNSAAVDSYPDWSPDGQKIAFGADATIRVMNADGSGARTVMERNGRGSSDGELDRLSEPSWSADGTRLAFIRIRCFPGDGGCDYARSLRRSNIDGTSEVQLQGFIDEEDLGGHEWAPDGSAIAFHESIGSHYAIFAVTPDGAQLPPITDWSNDTSSVAPDWSPDAARIVAVDETGMFVINRDGTGRTYLGPVAFSGRPAFSPDGSKIVFSFLKVMDANGSNPIDIGEGALPDWQPLPVTYPRPQGAAPLRASLVPAYRSCDPEQATLTHGSPLAQPSCASPGLTSGYLTQGSPDSNGAPANGVGFVRISETGETPIVSANGDQADVYLQLQMADVRNASDLTDYTGQLQVRPTLRITDKLNTPTPGVGYAATVSDISLSFDVPCTPTPSSTTGAHCSIATTAEALVPNMVQEAKRAIWELGRIRVFDGGPDGDAQTSPNTLFAVQGVFVP